MTSSLVRNLPEALSAGERRVFRLTSDGVDTRLFSMEASEITPGMQGDFFQVMGQIVYIFADHDIGLSRELLCAAGGVPMDRVHWLPDDQLNTMDITCMTPLALYRRLTGVSTTVSDSTVDRAWGLKRFAEGLLESRVRMEDESPWQKGLVLVSVYSVWDFLCTTLGDEGQSFWGWALEHTKSRQAEDGDDSRRKVMSGWMNAVRTFLLNEYEIPWVGQFKWDDFLGVPVSKCIRAAGTTRRGMMTPRMIAALFDSSVRVNRMRHILGQGDLAPAEEERIETDTVVADIDPEVVQEVVQEAAAELAHEEWERVREAVKLQDQSPRVRREYDSRAGTFYIWRGNVKTPVLKVLSQGDIDVEQFVEEVIGACGVRVTPYGR